MDTINATRPADGQEAQGLTQKTGHTSYNVRVHFSPTSKENMTDKILRLIRHDAETMRE